MNHCFDKISLNKQIQHIVIKQLLILLNNIILRLICCIFGKIKANKKNIWFNNRKTSFVGNKEITFFKNASSSSSQEIDASIWLVCEYVCYLKKMKCCGWLM